MRPVHFVVQDISFLKQPLCQIANLLKSMKLHIIAAILACECAYYFVLLD